MSHSVGAYEALASIYDHVMRHVDYGGWAAYVGKLFDRVGYRPRSILDVACGTGSVSLALRDQGLPVILGIDQSPAMIRVARRRAREAGYDIAFQVLEMRELSVPNSFDAAVCMYDSLNYLMEIEHVREALEAVYHVLHPGGVFLFDVCTERNSVTYFEDFRDQETGPGFSYARHSYYDRARRIQNTEFLIRTDEIDGPVTEHHQQRIYRLEEIRDTILHTRFDLLGTFSDFSFEPGTEKADRVHFMLQRPRTGRPPGGDETP